MDSRVFYPIADNPVRCVLKKCRMTVVPNERNELVRCVLKKCGMTFVPNEKNELVLMRLVTDGEFAWIT